MRSFLRTLRANLGVIGEFLEFLWERKLWWLIPLIIVLLLFG